MTPEPVAIPIPDPNQFVTEDDTPVDSLLSEKQQRLLTSCLYSSLTSEEPFLAAANVGLYYATSQPAIVPDVMLSFGVEVPTGWEEKGNRCYFVWRLGKPPDVAIEIVSNKVGNELGNKLDIYARARVAYYVVFDPLRQLGDEILQAYQLTGIAYRRLPEPWFEPWQLGLTLWSGEFEGCNWEGWLRWRTVDGAVLPTGDERAAQECQRAEQASQQAEQERQRAEQERQRAERLAALLRDRGIDPETLE